MIVICTKCQAKFRVADDKIGPRGAKVRCSRCQSVFQIRSGAAAPPPAEASPSPPPLAPPRPRAMDVELENPFAGTAGAAAAGADPFAAAGLGTALAPAPSRDPFAPAVPAADDPFAPRAEADPFAPPAESRAPASADAERLAVTDLSQLLGAPAPGEGDAPAAAQPGADDLGLPPMEPPSPDDGGLSLEDRITPPPVPAARPALDALGAAGGFPGGHAADAFTMGGDPNGFGAYDFGAMEADPSLPLANEPAGPAAEPRAQASAAPPASPPAADSSPAAPDVRPAPRAAPMAPMAEGLAEERLPEPRGSPLRALVVNAIALAALLLVTLAILVVWRSEGPLEAASLRPSAVLAALGRGGVAGPFAALEVRSGVYERERGPPLLFVRGKVISRAPAAVRGVRVSVEVLRAEGVVARGEAMAGAVPTAEELFRSGDGPSAGLAEAAASRVPPEIRPGDAVPFLVAVPDPPADLDGATVRVELAATSAPP